MNYREFYNNNGTPINRDTLVFINKNEALKEASKKSSYIFEVYGKKRKKIDGHRHQGTYLWEQLGEPTENLSLIGYAVAK
jgi:hypothetical protein